MSWDLVNSVIGGLSLLLSVIALLWISRAQAKTEMAQLELGIHQNLATAAQNLMQATSALRPLLAKKTAGPLSDAEQAELDMLMQELGARQEAYLNAYDHACGTYLERKIDETRFKRDYFHSLNNIISDKSLGQLLSAPGNRHSNIKAVWSKWDPSARS